MGDNAQEITMGDTFEADIYVTDKSGAVFPITDYTVRMAASKGSPSLDNVLVINKTGIVIDGPNGVAHIELTPAETIILSPGSFKYDIQITSPAGKVYTVVKYEDLDIGQSIAP